MQVGAAFTLLHYIIKMQSLSYILLLQQYLMFISKIACSIVMSCNIKNKDKNILQREQHCKGQTTSSSLQRNTKNKNQIISSVKGLCCYYHMLFLNIPT